MKGTKFCVYCRKVRPDEGFRLVPHPTRLVKAMMCPACQELRKKPRDELEALAQRESTDRKKVESDRTREFKSRVIPNVIDNFWKNHEPNPDIE